MTSKTLARGLALFLALVGWFALASDLGAAEKQTARRESSDSPRDPYFRSQERASGAASPPTSEIVAASYSPPETQPSSMPSDYPLLPEENAPWPEWSESQPGELAGGDMPSEDLAYRWTALGRAYYENDQRLEFTGQEATFGVEGILAGAVATEHGDWTTEIAGELFLNQPFDRNILVDQPVRRSFAGNFEIDPLEISQLYLSASRGDVLFSLGKMVTPFGRTYFPLYQNSRADAPFIRTESILWRETGLLMQYHPGPFSATVALVNGSLERDTNSSKGAISRLGFDGENHALGASLKWQDGIGSEGQKRYNRHLGVDAMLRRGPWVLSTEAIYDQYGFRRPFDPLDITWGRSVYNRDLFFAPGKPITGLGYYVDLGYQGAGWTAMLNYGEFHPRQIGDPIHDRTTRRGLGKLVRHISPRLDFYGMLLWENDVPVNQAGRRTTGGSVLCGFQYAL